MAPPDAARADASVHGLLDHLFRHQAGRLVAALVRTFGGAHLQLAEEVVQEAIVEALRRWPFAGVPESPVGWLHRVARHRALDRLRRDANFRSKEEAIRRTVDRKTEPLVDRAADRGAELDRHLGRALDGDITDDQLRLVFLCCHPELPRGGRVALTLKMVGGFGTGEIARAFFAKPSAIAQRLVRAKQAIRERELELRLPPPEDLPARLDAVLEAIYLIFNEGYVAHRGESLVRADLCREALRLVGHLAALPAMARPETHALAALLHFQASRLPARLDDDGELLPLADQDRTRWDRRMIARGFRHLDRAAVGGRVTPYHLEAGIAARHASASGDADTDWPAILALYDDLHHLAPSPVVELNRAIALARVRGSLAALDALDALADSELADYHLLHATRGDLLAGLGERAAAAAAFRRAADAAGTEPERRFCEKRLADLVGEKVVS